MSEHLTPLERADYNMNLLIKNYNEHLEEIPNKFRLLRMIVEDLIRDAKAYSLEAQQETPASAEEVERWKNLQRQVTDLTKKAQAASAETRPSSLATATSVVRPNGNRISSETYLLVRVDTNGGSETMAMVTYHAPNLPDRLGAVLKAWQGTVSDRKIHTTWELQSQSGATPSTTPAPAPAGPSAGGAESCPDSPASSPEPAQGGSEEDDERCMYCGHFVVNHTPSGTCLKADCACTPWAPSRTMKEGSERG